MTADILLWSVTLAQSMLIAAIGCYAYRVIRGPRTQDRILCLDAMYVSAMLLVLTIGIRTASPIYFEAALIIGVLGFVSSVALAKFLMRGEVIEWLMPRTCPRGPRC